MDTASLVVIIALFVVLVLVILMWRNATRTAADRDQAAMDRERALQDELLKAKAQSALGEVAQQALASAQAERTSAFDRASTEGALRAAAQTEAQGLRDQREEDLRRVRDLEQQVTAIRAERDQANSLLAAAREQASQLVAAQAAAQAAIADADQAKLILSSAEAAKATSEANLASARTQVLDLTSRLNAASQELEGERRAHATAVAEGQRLAGELKTAIAQSSDRTSMLIATQTDLKGAQTERDQAMAGRSAAEAAKATAEADLRAARDQVADLTARLTATSQALDSLRAQHQEATTQIQRLSGDLAQAAAIAEERQKAQDESRGQMATQLRSLTQQLYEEQGKAMMGEGRLAMEQTLAPLRERLQEFQTKLDQAHETDVRERASLQSEIKNLLAAETRLSAEAEQLGRALRADTKSQGTWGELTLERLLEASQLERGLAYELQVSVRDDEGAAGRPDAVIFLPDQKALAVDAKVSLTAFMRAINAESDLVRAEVLVDHARSVRNHMKSLADRDYPESLSLSLKGSSLDMVLLFMPSEAAFSAAVAQDSELWSDAWKNRVIIVSPTTLLATLRVVGQIWRVEKQNRNSAAIAKEAGGILEKLRGFLTDFEAIGNCGLSHFPNLVTQLAPAHRA